MSTYTYVRSEPYPEGHPLHDVAEIQWFRRELDVSEYRERLAKCTADLEEVQKELNEFPEEEVRARYEAALQALRDAIADK